MTSDDSGVDDRIIDPAALLAAVGAPGVGGTALFVGTVRDVADGRSVTGMDYTAYEPMAGAELARIVGEAHERFPGVRLAVRHRIGTLAIGDVAVAVAAAHARRAPAFDAARYVVEELKHRVPIWKREHYADGDRAWVDPTRSPAAGSG